MDVMLKDGDVYLSSSGMTEYIRAAQEAAQRAMIAASTTKGSFIYNRSLGTDYAALTDRGRMVDQLDMLVREAAAGIADAEVGVTAFDAERSTMTLSVTYKSTTITTEVDINGNL